MEARHARQWYAARHPGTATAFLAELDRAADCIQAHPDGWPAWRHGTRRFPLRRFPFFLIYRVTPRLAEGVGTLAALNR